jgi:hypothetical protein
LEKFIKKKEAVNTKIPSRWSNFFYTLTAYIFLMVMQVQINSSQLQVFTLIALCLLSLLLASSQLAFAFARDDKSDWFAALSGLNLVYVFIVYTWQIILNLGNPSSNIRLIFFDIGYLFGGISILFIWFSSEGFVNIQNFVGKYAKKPEIVQPDVRNVNDEPTPIGN